MKLMKNNVLRLIVLFTLSFLIILSNVCPAYVRADVSDNYSSVMDDLKKDSNFSIADYPVMSLDYFKTLNSDDDTTNDRLSMEIIQIAESDKGELFIYVYQPTDSELDLTATAISMSTEYSPDGQNISPDIYYLELVSSYGVFDKYLVKNFSVTNDLYRYYNIVCIYREYNSKIDTVAGGSLTDDYGVGVDVGQQWCASYQDNKLIYEKSTFETMEIDITFSGSMRFFSGFSMGTLIGILTSGDAWFIVFNIEDYVALHIYEAELVYQVRECSSSTGYSNTGDWSDDIKLLLSDTDTVSYTSRGLFSSTTYKWNRISKASDFLENAQSQNLTISNECKTALENSQWAFAFLETSYTYNPSAYNSKFWSEVQGVTVLRIKFLDISGKVYDLGVVSDRVHPDSSPDMEGAHKDPDWFKIIIALLLLILLLVILNSTGILPLIGKIVVFVITAPFKFIGWLIDKFKGD